VIVRYNPLVMDVKSDVRAQLKSLAIPDRSRPVSETALSRRWGVGRFLTLLVFVTASAVAAVAYWKNGRGERIVGSNKGPEVPLMTITRGRRPSPPAALTATGKIVSDHIVQVSTKVSGQIVALYFEQGDRVEKGRLLAQIEDVNYRARRDEAAARLVMAKANLEYQKVNFQRVASLVQDESAPPIEYADAQRWLRDAEGRVAAEEAALDFAQKALDDTQVKAPITGVILTRNVEVGDFVAAEGGRGANANAQFATIADMAKLRVEVDISELDIARLQKDMPCTVTPDAYKDRRYRGKVLWIDPGANYSKATVQVKVRIEDPDDFLRVEGSAQVAFLTESPAADTEGAEGIWIPAAACVLDDATGTGKVLVMDHGRLSERPIVTGRQVGSQIEVLSGLSEGVSIVAGRSATNRH
jgi:RND family efflux transporter MFP subunit